MQDKTKLIIILSIFVLIIISGIIIYNLLSRQGTEAEELSQGTVNGNESITNTCTDLGCEEGEIYVGSKNSDKYYECDCGWAKLIKQENIVCFHTDLEAEIAGYEKREC